MAGNLVGRSGVAGRRPRAVLRRRSACPALVAARAIGYGLPRTTTWPSGPLGRRADVAQLVEHHLAKVRVAGSNPVVRSDVLEAHRPHSVEWPRGEATACKAVYTGSNPVSTSRTPARAIGAVWLARFPDTEEVTGSSPVSPTSSTNAPELRVSRGRGPSPFAR